MKFVLPFVTRARYERELEQASSLTKTVASMVDREYGRATADVNKTVHSWALDQNEKQFYGGRVNFQVLATRFAPAPTTISGVFEQADLKKVGDRTPTQHSIDLMTEIANENKAFSNPGGHQALDFGENNA